MSAPEIPLVRYSEGLQPEPESASSQALRIPHILSAVLFTLHDEHRLQRDLTLVSCTLVNSMWAEEANKLLWEKCGEKRYPNGRCFPRVQDLVEIKMERLQKYANYIRLFIVQGQHSKEGPIVWEGSYLTKISHLSFPRLEWLEISSPWSADYDSLPITQFVHSRLQSLVLTVSNYNHFVLSEEFLQLFQRESPGLRRISIEEEYRGVDFYDTSALNGKWKPSPSRLVTFLQAFKSLESIHWSVPGVMSKAAFRLLCTLPCLKSISFWPIYDAWVDDLPHSGFPAIEEVSCEISASTLEVLVPLIEPVLTLYLTESDLSAGLWQVILKAPFKDLECLDLHLQSSTPVSGKELASLGRCFPQMRKLKLDVVCEYMRRDERLLVVGLKDETIRELAEHLPMLTDLFLECHGDEPNALGEASLIALGKFCPLLRRCLIYATLNWENFANNTPRSAWSNLEELTIFRSGSEYDEAAEYRDMEKDARDWAKRVRELQ